MLSLLATLVFRNKIGKKQVLTLCPLLFCRFKDKIKVRIGVLYMKNFLQKNVSFILSGIGGIGGLIIIL